VKERKRCLEREKEEREIERVRERDIKEGGRRREGGKKRNSKR
jgi:hypothetical protein